MVNSRATTRAGLRAFKRACLKAQRAHQRVRLRVLAKMKKRKHILALQIIRKLELSQPLSDFEWAYVKRKPRGQHKKYAESMKNRGFLKPNQISELKSMFKVRCCISAILIKLTRTQRENSAYLVQGFHNHWCQTHKRVRDFDLVRAQWKLHGRYGRQRRRTPPYLDTGFHF